MQAIFHHVIALAVALAIALIVAALPAQAAEDPRDFVAAIYQSYVGKDAKGIPINSPRARQLITPSLMKLIDADAGAAAKRGEPPRLDGDPFIDAQDFDIKSFNVEVQEVGRARAVATDTFKNEASAGNDPIVLVLVKIGDAWRVDDFRGGSGSVRNYLSRKPGR
ncbi:MAG: YbjP/YqhG family protein [Xanthobacteraceae bacterium]|nr:YbjP/YqhG family protein [Xanthobacteraceae bacterium]